MMIRALATTAGALTLLLSGTTAASAYPITGSPELTQNPLYKLGSLPTVSCKATKGTTKSSTAKYLNKIVSCLNTAWGKTKKDFVPAELTIKDTYEQGLCHTGLDVSGSFATSCDRTVQVQLRSDWIKARSDLAILVELTRAYGEFVQAQTGISEAWWALRYDGEQAEMDEQTHRFYLQADCLAGVSIKSLGRSAKNWKPLLDAETPGEYDRFNWYGKPANRLSWFTAGYGSAKPGACNTWKASSPKVA
ncbi:neutral zinc metallopeptidase [Streptosporangium sp. NPDC051023]|uniref:neutral zinc metallopeptidase n=1 Tax=Streptosporangium sp. NPDC051023 TaxID=3155410 RepID=UPI00344D09B7